MKISKVEKAITEARRFIDKAHPAVAKIKDMQSKGLYFAGSKETAACRRASLDLTRSLAELRK